MTDHCVTIECPDRDSWLRERRLGIGASEAAAVLGVSSWKGPMEVWAEKVGIGEPDAEESEFMKWGLRLEDVIADAYAEETERLILPAGPNPWTISRSVKHPFLQATLDREIVPIDDRGPGLLELKTAIVFKKEEWADEPPLQYQIQFQHQLKVKGYRWGALAVLIGGYKFLRMDMVADPAFQDVLVQKLEAFWELVVKETPPPVDGSEGAKDVLARLYPKQEPGKVVQLPNEAISWDQELVEVKAQAKKVDDRERELKNFICAAIGDAELGLLPSGDGYTWKHIHKAPYQVAEQNYRELRRKARKAGK